MHRYRLSYQQYSIDNLSDAFGSRIPLNESDIFAGKRYIYIYIYIYIGGVTVSCVQAARNARTSNPCRGMLEFATGCWPRQTRTAIAPIFPFFQANASIFLPALLIGRPRSEAFRSFSRHLEKVTGNGESREGKSRGQLFRSRSTPRHSRFHEFLPYLPSNALLSLFLSLFLVREMEYACLRAQTKPAVNFYDVVSPRLAHTVDQSKFKLEKERKSLTTGVVYISNKIKMK